MKVKDVMTRDVAYIKPDASVFDAANIMQQNDIGSLPVVCDQSGVVGIVTDRDIVVRNVITASDPKTTPVSNIMTTNISTVTPDTEVEQLGTLMANKQIRRIPVVDNNALVGIVALGDLATDRRFDIEAAVALTDISKPCK